MFTGIVQGKSKVLLFEDGVEAKRLVLEFNSKMIKQLEIGASVCISGACLTVVDIEHHHVHFDVSAETIEKTAIAILGPGDVVNVERSYKVGDEIGGHILSGHIIGTGEIVAIEDNVWTFGVSQEWMKYILEKGFIAVDGCSLTVVNPDSAKGTFLVAFIPETLEKTTFGEKSVGEKVNIEIDSQTQAIVETTERVLAQRI